MNNPMMDLVAAVQAADGICPGCRERYQKGDVVESVNGAAPRHTDCEDRRLESDPEDQQ